MTWDPEENPVETFPATTIAAITLGCRVNVPPTLGRICRVLLVETAADRKTVSVEVEDHTHSEAAFPVNKKAFVQLNVELCPASLVGESKTT